MGNLFEAVSAVHGVQHVFLHGEHEAVHLVLRQLQARVARILRGWGITQK